jgi:putative ABC transport system permease protein
MIKLYFKIALRYLFKNKLYSFINIGGLAIGIASFVLIMAYVAHEKSYDRFPGSENVYRLYMDYLEGDTYEPGDVMTYNASGPELKALFPEIEDFVRFYYFERMTFEHDGLILEQAVGSLADASYFSIFGYPLLKGTPEKALEQPNSIVLTETLAQKLFGTQDPIGKTLNTYWEGYKTVLTVTGLMADIPQNAHYRNNYLISFATEKTWGIFNEQQLRMNFNMNNYYTYIRLAPNTVIDQLRHKIIASDIEGSVDERHNLEALEKIHLYSDKPYEVSVNGSATRVNFLTVIAFIILVLSWLNYINLSTTKSLERAKEIGIRKVSGAQRPQLILQALVESTIINLVALAIGLLLAYMALPLFNTIIGVELLITTNSLSNVLPYIALILLGIVLAGIYPALLLSSYNPIKALKGKIQTQSNGPNLRKGLIVTQFIATIVLLIGTFMVTKQIQYLQNKPLGTDLNQVVALKGEIISTQPDSLVTQSFYTFKEEIERFSFVEKTAVSQTYPGDSFDNISSTKGMTLPNGTKNTTDIFYTYQAQSEYFDLIGLEWVAGGSFTPTTQDNGKQVVVNETFLKEMGISAEAIVHKNLSFWGNQKWFVSGVFKDYHHFGHKGKLLPMLIRQRRGISNLLVKLDQKALSANGVSGALSQLEAQWKAQFPKSTFKYTFLNQNFQAQYQAERNFSTAFQVFTFLAIFIAALGLFGLTSYTVVLRKKEIGVRKVNGATLLDILHLLNIDFVKWIGLSFVLAIPIGWFAMDRWLQGFAYKTELSWWVFALAGIAALLVALITVSGQSLQAALANPVDSLRDE